MNHKPLSEAVQKGMAYLINQQHPEGGWCQGGGWRVAEKGGRVQGPDVQDPPDLCNTSVAVLALLRGGHNPREGDYSAHVFKGLDFIIREVEQADFDSPHVSRLRDTQIQSKIGQQADTFLAVNTLAEAKGFMPDDESENRLCSALDKVISKLERHQQEDGTWSMRGWAPVVGQSLAHSGLNLAQEKGAQVSDEVLEKSEKYSRQQFDSSSKKFAMGGSAGVALYGTATHLSSKSKTVRNYKNRKAKWEQTVADANSAENDKKIAEEKLKYLQQAEAAQELHLEATRAERSDPGFRSGFGSNGGEEFLSYLNIGETLAEKGGKEWEEWNKSMTENLERIQNADGSWTGHHCITGRTFCTATALLVLLVDLPATPTDSPVAKQFTV